MAASAIMDKHRRGAFLVSEANGTRSREVCVVTPADLKAGTVVSVSNGTADALTNATVAKGILFEEVKSTDVLPKRTVITRDAEVNFDDILFPVGFTAGEIATAITELVAVGVIILNVPA